MEAFIAGAAAAIIGMLSGQGLMVYTRNKRISRRLTAIEQSIPELITRGEVQGAFAEMAKIEGQRMAQQQQQNFQRPQVQQPPRTAQVFPQSQALNQVEGLNKNINNQLDDLSKRINNLNQQMGL